MKETIMLVLLSVFLVGCTGAIKDMIQSGQYEKEIIDKDKAEKRAWTIYEVWLNENDAGLILTSQPDEAKAYRIVLAPLYYGDETIAKRNEKTVNDWLNGLVEDDDDIYYLAIRKYEDSLSYNTAFDVYKRWWDETNAINNEGLKGEGFMRDPLKVYVQKEREYGFKELLGKVYFGMRTQDRYDLEISKGVAKIID